MKALVVVGGVASPASVRQLVPVANKPVLFYGLEAIAAAGIREVGIVVGGTDREIFEAVCDGSAFGLDVTYITKEAPRGLAHAVLVSRDFLGDDDFVMYPSDSFIVGGITDLVRSFDGASAQVLLARVADPRASGVAELGADGRVTRLEENPESDLALAGVYIFTPAIHRAIAGLKSSGRGELEIAAAIRWLLSEGQRVDSTIITGYLKDTGNVADVLEANRLVLANAEPSVAGWVDEESELIGRVVIEPGAVVTRSRIVGPAIIGLGTHVIDSYVGPSTSIDRDCVVAGSAIEYSIMQRGASARGVRRIACSLIGRGVQVTAAPNRKSA